MTPATTYPDLRLPTDATWQDAAEALALWLHHARCGHACPNPPGWSWRGDDMVTEWGQNIPGRAPDEDHTDTGAAVERIDGRWRWRVWDGSTTTMSGLPDRFWHLGPERRDVERRAATWADPRDALADAERWLDENHPEWREGVKYVPDLSDGWVSP